MDDTNQGEHQDAQSTNPHRSHVRIFGVEVSGQNGEAWKGRREEWKKERQDARNERRGMSDEDRAGGRHGHHGGGFFFGLLVLFLGIILFLGTLGLIPRGFWHEIAPFWPVLLILWGLDILLGRNVFSRFVVALLALAFFLAIVSYGLVKTASPMVSRLPTNVVNAAGTINSQNPFYYR